MQFLHFHRLFLLSFVCLFVLKIINAHCICFFSSPFFSYFRLMHLFLLLVCHLPSPTHSAVDEVTGV